MIFLADAKALANQLVTRYNDYMDARYWNKQYLTDGVALRIVDQFLIDSVASHSSFCYNTAKIQHGLAPDSPVYTVDAINIIAKYSHVCSSDGEILDQEMYEWCFIDLSNFCDSLLSSVLNDKKTNRCRIVKNEGYRYLEVL